MTRNVRAIRGLGFGLGLAVAAAATAQAPPLARMDVVQRSVPAGPVALIDGAPVGREDFLYLYGEQLMGRAMAAGTKDPEDGVRVMTGLRCLGELVQREILHQVARRRGMTVSAAELTEAYTREFERLQRQFAERGGTAPTEAEILERSGRSQEEAREDMRKALLVKKARDAIVKEQGLTVPEADVRKFYESRPELFRRPSGMHLRQVYVAPKPNPRDAGEAAWKAARKTLEKALARMRAGESFAAVARAVSEAPDKDQGGDLGMRPRTQLPEFLVEIAQAMSPGDTSDIIRSEHGLHIIQLVATEPGEDVSLEEAHGRIEALLLEVKAEEAVNTFCQPIVDDPERVKIFLQLEKTLAGLPDLDGLEDLSAGS